MERSSRGLDVLRFRWGCERSVLVVEPQKPGGPWWGLRPVQMQGPRPEATTKTQTGAGGATTLVSSVPPTHRLPPTEVTCGGDLTTGIDGSK